MKKPAAPLRVIGNPVAFRATDDGDVAGKLRRLDCSEYGRCLDLAVSVDWEGFTCQACDAYQAESPAQRHVSLSGALRLGLEVIAPLVGVVSTFDDEAGDADAFEESCEQAEDGRGEAEAFDDEEATSNGDALMALYRRTRP